MTPERAKEVINHEEHCVERQLVGCDKNCYKCDLVLPDTDVFEAYKTAKAAIERCMVAKKSKALINKKTIKIGNAKWNKGTTVFKCSNCGQFISRIYKHCGDCGQLIDWSDTECI